MDPAESRPAGAPIPAPAYLGIELRDVAPEQITLGRLIQRLKNISATTSTTAAATNPAASRMDWPMVAQMPAAMNKPITGNQTKTSGAPSARFLLAAPPP